MEFVCFLVCIMVVSLFFSSSVIYIYLISGVVGGVLCVVEL